MDVQSVSNNLMVLFIHSWLSQLFHTVLRDNVVQCLNDSGLSLFADELMNFQDLYGKLRNGSSKQMFTIFAPSDEAFDSDMNSFSVEGHIAEFRISSKTLFFLKVIATRSKNVSLHVGIVQKRGQSEKVTNNTQLRCLLFNNVLLCIYSKYT